MVIYDENEPIEKIKVFDKGIDIHDDEEIYKARISYRTGDIFSPYIEQMEALQVEVQHFADCIEGKAKPFTDVNDGFNAGCFKFGYHFLVCLYCFCNLLF